MKNFESVTDEALALLYVEGNNRVDINKQGVFTVPKNIIENSLKEPSIDDENIYAKGEFYED